VTDSEAQNLQGAARRPGQRVRLIDVATEAGVSKGIASRILNNTPIPIRPETRDRVVSAAQRLGYVPHSTARSLRSSRTGAVAFVVPDFTNPVWTQLIRGAFAEAHRNGLSLMVVEDRPESEVAVRMANLAVSGQVDGLVIASAYPGNPMLEDLARHTVPHVFLNRGVPGSGRNVDIDQRGPTKLALEYLVGLGHTRIGHITGPLGLTTSQARADAFTHHAKRLKLELAPVISGGFSERGGAEAARDLLTRHPEVTAVTVALLTQAVGVLYTASEMGIAVPGRLAVMAHDDLDLAGYLQPPLTTVKIPLERAGAAAVEALVDQLKGAEPSDRMVISDAELVIRRST
jgi:DNA-binding LacI/PurR family transcriptional regulator